MWTKAELVRYAAKHHIMPAQQAGKLHREELCVKVADWAYPHRRAAATFKIPMFHSIPAMDTRGNTSYVLPFIYALLKRYPDCCFYMNPDGGFWPTPAREGVAFDCGTEEVIVRPHPHRANAGL